MNTPNIHWHEALVSRLLRERMNGHKSFILWFTGLPDLASTLAHAVEGALYELGCRTFVFDGDNVRHGLCADLGFSSEDRVENIRRIGEMAKLFTEAGVIALTAFIHLIVLTARGCAHLLPRMTSSRFLSLSAGSV